MSEQHEGQRGHLTKDIYPQEAQMAIDPVCSMEVDERSPAATTHYNGMNYYFCSQECKEAFEEDPEEYINAAA